MLNSIFEKKCGSKLVLVATAAVLVAGCAATVHDTAWVEHADLPDYRVGNHRIEDPVDLYIEPRIKKLRRIVTPHSKEKDFNPIPIIVGPMLDSALLQLTQQHFSKITPVPSRGNRPTLTYELLSYRPDVSVVPGFFSTRLNVSARLVIQISIHSSTGEMLFSSTTIGTSHVSDTDIAAGDGLKDGPRLLQIATRDAIIDTLYDMSSVFGNSSRTIHDDMRAGEIDPGLEGETIEDVVMHLRTWHE